ncbi:LamG domain-containing protein [Streptomyces sp. KLOTTS4A1]|uniref:LamG domain-containing protein n=1 Tax=Streptomyces sp. KLOTTS4A1 TaxID=3390996 RepID=UPI0039F5F3F1
MLLGGLALAVVLGTPGVAVAAESQPPLQPAVADLATSSKACTSGDARPYLDHVPRVSAKLYAADESDLVSAEFEAWWKDSEGVEQRRSLTTGAKTSGSPFSWQLPSDAPADTVVSWRVRANDGEAVSLWSDEGSGKVCQYIYDDASPLPPEVRSDDYPNDDTWTEGVGDYGTFTADSASDDAVAYAISFNGGTNRIVRPEQPGGPVSVRFLPVSSGLNWVEVQTQDRAGRRSSPTNYQFRVSSGREPVARWNLADAAGSSTAEAVSGPEARVDKGVTFGAPGLEGTELTSSASFSGSTHGFITPDADIVDTTGTFAVSAWVRPSRTDQAMTVASQDAAKGDASAFTLGLRAGSEKPVWSFDFGGARVTGGTPETGKWAHVMGLYDAETGLARLYVNGKAAGDGAKAEAAGSDGDFQIGRVRRSTGYRDRWHGEIGNVRVHDRVVVPSEVQEFAKRKPVERGHWKLESATDGSSPELHGGQALNLGEGASVYRQPTAGCIPELDPDCPQMKEPLEGEGFLALDGESAYAATSGPVVDTDASFTVSAVVRLADTVPGHPMTVLSQGGEHGDAFKVRYDPATERWELVMTAADEPGAQETVVGQYAYPDGGWGWGHEVTVVYDDAAGKVTLYVDGQLDQGASATFRTSWRSSGPLQIGRGKTADGWGEYLHGSVDEVRVFSGVVDENRIGTLRWGMELPR